MNITQVYALSILEHATMIVWFFEWSKLVFVCGSFVASLIIEAFLCSGRSKRSWNALSSIENSAINLRIWNFFFLKIQESLIYRFKLRKISSIWAESRFWSRRMSINRTEKLSFQLKVLEIEWNSGKDSSHREDSFELRLRLQ